MNINKKAMTWRDRLEVMRTKFHEHATRAKSRAKVLANKAARYVEKHKTVFAAGAAATVTGAAAAGISRRKKSIEREIEELNRVIEELKLQHESKVRELQAAVEENEIRDWEFKVEYESAREEWQSTIRSLESSRDKLVEELEKTRHVLERVRKSASKRVHEFQREVHELRQHVSEKDSTILRLQEMIQTYEENERANASPSKKRKIKERIEGLIAELRRRPVVRTPTPVSVSRTALKRELSAVRHERSASARRRSQERSATRRELSATRRERSAAGHARSAALLKELQKMKAKLAVQRFVTEKQAAKIRSLEIATRTPVLVNQRTPTVVRSLREEYRTKLALLATLSQKVGKVVHDISGMPTTQMNSKLEKRIRDVYKSGALVDSWNDHMEVMHNMPTSQENRQRYEEAILRMDNTYQTFVNFVEDFGGLVRVYVRIKGRCDSDTCLTIQARHNPTGPEVLRESALDLIPTFLYLPGCSTEQKTGCIYGKYTNVYGKYMTNEDIYATMSSTLQQVKAGYNLVLFGYGYSGSGKTYTLTNRSGGPTQLGILHRFMEEYPGTMRYRVLRVNKVTHADNGAYYGNKKKKPDVTKSGDRKILNGLAFTEETNYVTQSELKELQNPSNPNGIVKPTPNNPESSRGHLFYEYEVKGGGTLVFVDMAGRENAIDIVERVVDVDKFNADGRYKDPVRTIVRNVMAPKQRQARQVMDALETSMRKNGRKSRWTVDQLRGMVETGIWINETINHMLDFFANKTGISSAGTTFCPRTNNNHPINDYNPECKIQEQSLITSILEAYDEASADKPTKFIMMCNIRQEIERITDSEATLQFADRVKST